MPVVMVIAIVVVFVVVVFVAAGRGDGLSAERGDYVPLDMGPVSATDVALLRPPTALWGYSVAATDEAMEQIAESIRERDVRIVALEQLVTDLSRDHEPALPLGSPYAGARHRRGPADLGQPESADPFYDPGAQFDPGPRYDGGTSYDAGPRYDAATPYEAATPYDAGISYDAGPRYDARPPYDDAAHYGDAERYDDAAPSGAEAQPEAAPPGDPAAAEPAPPPEQSHD